MDCIINERSFILVVDDDAVIREVLRRVLGMEGYEVEVQTNGRAALDHLQERSFDLLITDLKMPVMNGLDLLQAVRLLQPEMPIILITGYAAIDNAVEVMQKGAADYLAKPFTNEEIVAKVRKALDSRAILLDEIYLLHELQFARLRLSGRGKSRNAQGLPADSAGSTH